MRGPVFRTMIRVRASRGLRRLGYSHVEVAEMMDDCDDDVIDAAAVSAAVTIPPTTGAIGDGSIIAAIVEFLKSEQGQALIKALIALLIGLI